MHDGTACGFVLDDGGRAAAGDCVTRAIAIAMSAQPTPRGSEDSSRDADRASDRSGERLGLILLNGPR
jgi:hypothetical protein